tara:strand:+ start:41 stop:550 length:510 start_codon:yes stop_codon:yes gene_type:complete
MATRIGKYKVSKRESAVSLIDGGVSSGTIAARGYTATTPSITAKWPAHSAAGDGADKTLTIAQILTGVITSDPTADRDFTMPTAALAVAGVKGVAIGDCIDFTIINLGTANADEIITLAAGTGGTLVGSGAVLTSNAQDNEFSSGSGLFRIRFTGVASGSEAIVIYRLA